jgi:hypothetical protein
VHALIELSQDRREQLGVSLAQPEHPIVFTVAVTLLVILSVGEALWNVPV